VDLFRFLGIGLMAARKQVLANFADAGVRRNKFGILVNMKMRLK
jgi:hypothetical protein